MATTNASCSSTPTTIALEQSTPPPTSRRTLNLIEQILAHPSDTTTTAAMLRVENDMQLAHILNMMGLSTGGRSTQQLAQVPGPGRIMVQIEIGVAGVCDEAFRDPIPELALAVGGRNGEQTFSVESFALNQEFEPRNRGA